MTLLGQDRDFPAESLRVELLAERDTVARWGVQDGDFELSIVCIGHPLDNRPDFLGGDVEDARDKDGVLVRCFLHGIPPGQLSDRRVASLSL